MIEEPKVPTVVTGKPPMSFQDRIPGLSWTNLRGEVKRLSRQASKTKNLEEGALATVLLNVFFNHRKPEEINQRGIMHDRGDDPYCRRHNPKGNKFMEIKSSGKKRGT